MSEITIPGYGQPGEPGEVKVIHLKDLKPRQQIPVAVGSPGSGGTGGHAAFPNAEGIEESPNLGGAGGGRENVPIIEALRAYADSKMYSYLKPLCFEEPGLQMISWPYDTSTATMVIIGPSGGGGGGNGQVSVPGEGGENGLGGAVFIFPTDLPTYKETAVP